MKSFNIIFVSLLLVGSVLADDGNEKAIPKVRVLYGWITDYGPVFYQGVEIREDDRIWVMSLDGGDVVWELADRKISHEDLLNELMVEIEKEKEEETLFEIIQKMTHREYREFLKREKPSLLAEQERVMRLHVGFLSEESGSLDWHEGTYYDRGFKKYLEGLGISVLEVHLSDFAQSSGTDWGVMGEPREGIENLEE